MLLEGRELMNFKIRKNMTGQIMVNGQSKNWLNVAKKIDQTVINQKIIKKQTLARILQI